MVKKETTLLFDGTHFRVTIPKGYIKMKGWSKGDNLLLEENNGTITVKNTSSKQSMPEIYSIGYEGKSIDQFISRLQDKDIQQIIDIREIPFSFKSGFSKRPLIDRLGNVGIGYHHLKEMGTQKKSRDEYKRTGNIEKLCKTFSIRLEKSIDQYNILFALASYQKSAIMCFEDDYKSCHRQVIEQKLMDDGFNIRHLSRNNK